MKAGEEKRRLGWKTLYLHAVTFFAGYVCAVAVATVVLFELFQRQFGELANDLIDWSYISVIGWLFVFCVGLIGGVCCIALYCKLISATRMNALAIFWIFLFVLVGEGATWHWGLPAVMEGKRKEVFEAYKEIHGYTDAQVKSKPPYFDTFTAFPVAPFIVASYNEYQIANLNGLGSWDFDLWYGPGAIRFFYLTVWVS